MKIKITNGELVNTMIPSLTELIMMKTPLKVNYAANKTLNICNSERVPIDKTRKDIFEGLCNMDKDGKPKIEKDEYCFADPAIKQEAINKVMELFAIETEIEMHTVPIELIDQIEGKTGGTWINYLIGKFFVEPEIKQPLEIVEKP